MTELVRDKPGIDEVKIQTEEELPHLIPADYNDGSVSEAGRNEDNVSDSASDADLPIIIRPEILTPIEQLRRVQLVPDRCNETTE